MKCQNPNCGKIIEEDSKFCIHCGKEQNISGNSKIVDHSSEKFEQTQKKFCCNSSCNQLIDSDSFFCDFCGTKQPVINYEKGNLVEFHQEGKWGFKDVASRDIIIPPIYDYTGPFVNDRAVVRRNNKYCYVDENGNELTSFKYDYAKDFNNNHAKVKRDDKWAFINTECEQITPFKYDDAENFADGFALVSLDEKLSLINETGKEIGLFQYDQIVRYSNDLFKVKQKINVGLMDKKGNEILPCKYYHIGEINDGLAKISTRYKHGLINSLGEIILPCQYNKLQNLAEGVIAAKEKKKWKCFDNFGYDISESNSEFSKFLNNKKRNKTITRKFFTVMAIILVLSGFSIYDYATNDIGLVRMIQTWVLGEDEMDWRDARENVSIYDISPLEEYLKKHPNGKYVYYAKERLEKFKWRKVETENTIESYSTYLRENPDGKYVQEAKPRLEELQWVEAEKENTIESFVGYLEKYPDGKMSSFAKEIIEWKKVEDQNTILAYIDYLEKYPEGEFEYSAKDKVEELNWEIITEQNRKEDYLLYLEDYPNGIYAEEARAFIRQAEVVERENNAWSLALRVNSIQSYVNYMTQYPNGKYSDRALQKLEAKTICESCTGSGKCWKCNGTSKFGKERKLFYDRCPKSSRTFHGRNCRTCGGDGKINERYGLVDADCRNCYNGKCEKCDGTGNIQIKWLTEWYANREGMTLCSRCEGSGKCYRCNGSGHHGRDKRIIWDPCPVKVSYGNHYGCGCGGDGKIRERYEYYNVRCDVCNGFRECRICDGEGLIPKND